MQDNMINLISIPFFYVKINKSVNIMGLEKFLKSTKKYLQKNYLKLK